MSDKTLAERIHEIEFEHCFVLHSDGSITDAVGVWAPECYHDDERDIDLCGGEREWKALTGFTGQYGYHGAVMHPSEFIGKGIADYMLGMTEDGPVTFVLVVVECLPERRAATPAEVEAWLAGHQIDDGEPEETPEGLEIVEREPEPAGWAILYRTVE